MFNIGNAELTAGELRQPRLLIWAPTSPYNLKKLVDLATINHQGARGVDRRAVRISLTEHGTEIAETSPHSMTGTSIPFAKVGGIGASEFEELQQADAAS